MSKFKGLILLITSSILVSCSSSNSTKEINSEENKVKMEYPTWINKKLSDFPLLNLEFEVKKSFFKDSIRNHRKFELSIDEVKRLSKNLNTDDETQRNSYILNSFYKIAKSKLDKKYSEYEASLDIGMMRDARCFSLGRFEVNDSTTLILWKIEYSSYEACPFFAGSHILVTVVSAGKVYDCLQFAQQESAGDAPMHAYTIQTGKISLNGMVNYHYECIVEEDEEEIEHPEYKKRFILEENVFKLKNGDKK
jgi:hypothetical protein